VGVAMAGVAVRSSSRQWAWPLAPDRSRGCFLPLAELCFLHVPRPPDPKHSPAELMAYGQWSRHPWNHLVASVTYGGLVSTRTRPAHGGLRQGGHQPIPGSQSSCSSTDRHFRRIPLFRRFLDIEGSCFVPNRLRSHQRDPSARSARFSVVLQRKAAIQADGLESFGFLLVEFSRSAAQSCRLLATLTRSPGPARVG